MKKTYKFANTNFLIESYFDYFFDFAKEYVVDEPFEKEIKVSLEEIKSWKDSHDDCKGYSLEYIETLVIHSKVADLLALENKFIFHGSSIYVKDKDNAYIFAAVSGTGKSTHVKLLKKVYGDEVVNINDDKPFIGYENNNFVIYGSPWNGKERLSNNISAHLRGVFVLSRAKSNEVSKYGPKEAITHLINQMHFPKGMLESSNATNTLIKLCESLPIYNLMVNMEDDAAKLSYEIMSK